MRKILLALCFFAFSVPGALGANGFYAGANFQMGGLEADDFQGVPVNFEAVGPGYKIFGGYQFHDLGILNYVAVEASWEDLGTFEDDVFFGFGPRLRAEVDVDGYTVALLGVVPTGDVVRVFGKAGYYDFDGEVELEGLKIGDFSDDGLLLGLGVMGRITQSSSWRAEFTWFDTDDPTTWTVGLGAQWHFGGRE